MQWISKLLGMAKIPLKETINYGIPRSEAESHNSAKIVA